MDVRRKALLALIELMRREPSYRKHAGNMRFMNAVYRKLVNDLSQQRTAI